MFSDSNFSFQQALSLDDGGHYHERLETSLHRLELRAELYKPPERLEGSGCYDH